MLEKIWGALFVLTIMLPIGNSQYPFFDALINKYGVTILDVMDTLDVAACVLLRMSKRNIKCRVKIGNLWRISLVCLAISLFFMSLWKGYQVYGVKAIRDAFNYVVCIEFLLLSILLKHSKLTYGKILELAEIGFIGYTINTVLTTTFIVGFGSRVSGNSFSLAIMLVPFEVYKYLKNYGSKLKNYGSKNRIFAVLLCFMINTVLSQDRAIIALTGLGSIFVALDFLKGRVTRKQLYKLLGISAAACIFIVVLAVSKASVLIRIITGGEIDTFTGRLFTFKYYYDAMKKNIWGYGFGYVMHFFTAGNYMLPKETYQIDNAFVVYGVKGGFLFSIVCTALAMIPMLDSIGNKTMEYKMFRISYLFLLVSAYLFTSQIIQGRATAMLIWTLVGMSIKNYKEGIFGLNELRKTKFETTYRQQL